MTGPCPFSCANKTEFGYCKTTACLYAPTIMVTSTPRGEKIKYINLEKAIEQLEARKIIGMPKRNAVLSMAIEVLSNLQTEDIVEHRKTFSEKEFENL